MNTKAFMTLLITVLILGAALGGAFAGGIALGKSQEDGETESTPTAPQSGATGQEIQGESGVPSLDQIRQRIQSGEITQEELAELREQFQGQGGAAGGGGGFAGGGGAFGGRGFGGGGGLVGTIEKIEGNVLTVNTQQGPLLATIGADSTIRMFSEGTLADLLTGTRVTVTGQRGEDGTVQATLVLITPEGAEGFFGGGLGDGGGQRRGGGS